MTALPRIFISSRGYLLVRSLLGLLFLYAGIMKLGNLQGFGAVIDDFGLLPETLVWPVAVILPAVELLAALGLLLDMRGALSAVVIMLLLFIAVLSYGIRLGLDIDCGCFGPEAAETQVYNSLHSSLARDMAMMMGAVYLYWWRQTQLTKQARQGLFIRNK
ncbi:MAG: DoxX family membrane protein [Proteobacteria bacterium]|nr:DoxX family membrane protein [Pseudomonadota bacterium]MBU4297799.1 DoxX family membrane protein [Pseudomonadota bacterium]MCG2748334.1 DoxX family membrane protein [Desulfobulbaceae bacterium]